MVIYRLLNYQDAGDALRRADVSRHNHISIPVGQSQKPHQRVKRMCWNSYIRIIDIGKYES